MHHHRPHTTVVYSLRPGPNYQFDHLLFLEALQLPAEAADPKSEYGSYMHILAAGWQLGPQTLMIIDAIGDPSPREATWKALVPLVSISGALMFVQFISRVAGVDGGYMVGGSPWLQVPRSVDYEFPPALMSLLAGLPPIKSEESRQGQPGLSAQGRFQDIISYRALLQHGSGSDGGELYV